ncbi:MAG: penicillin-binding protein 2 [Proteobacteria bacterium]|nr:penicillin-binding protein 2 [Pseudomonadota bacterium]MBU1650532.1 penicillin-binding protein 2 [Pseudomonadota bacterium]
MKWTFLKELGEISEYDQAALDALRKRVLGAGLVIVFFVAMILLRLWFLQIHKGEEYKNRAENNRVRIQEEAAPRGDILDRNGKELVTNQPSFNVVLVREDSNDIDDLLKRLSVVLKEDVSVLWERIRDAERKQKHIPILLKGNLSWDTLAYLETHNKEFPGIRIEVFPRRFYHYGDMAAHIIGYLGEINKNELERQEADFYRGGDLVGKMGLEKLREKELRGEKGSSSSEVNARGFEQQLLTHEEPVPGNEVRLTLDIDLQQVAEDTMDADERAGAVVAMEVKTGRLLVLASTPRLHLADFEGGISTKNWNALLDNPKHPLINKTLQAMYPPGSTYKMVTALAGLAKGVINKDTTFFCPGYISYGNRRYNCWKHGGHGTVDLKRAISESCDVYFYQVGMRVGVDALAEYANKLGLGLKTQVELEYEKSGLIPTKEWKKKKYGVKWQDGETLSLAIGQGFNLLTPIQLCQMTAILANGGKRYVPQLIESVTDADGKVLESFTPKLAGELKEDEKKYLALIREGMVEVVQGARGTARSARIEGINMGGKTGTAQVVRLEQYKHLKEDDIPYKYRDHAWFTCFAPAEDPEIAVTVLVEHGLHGGSGAAPVAKAVMQKYFADRMAVDAIRKAIIQ